MFELCLQAKLPFVGVSTDDRVNFTDVLQLIAKREVKEFTPHDKKTGLKEYLYWTGDVSYATPDLYKDFMKSDSQLVFVNTAPNSLIFDSGILPTPPSMIEDFLKHHVMESDIEPISKALRGLSAKSCVEVVMLTQARAGCLSPNEIRKTRSAVSQSVQGLYPVDTSYDFYVYPEKLQEWIALNGDYFLTSDHPKLTPRGLLLDGEAGVGKSMAAKVIANHLKLPLYRLDIATTLDKYIGVSESRTAKILSLVDREEPCVLLIDEVEKIFSSQGDDAGVTQRILSQLLWWLAEHQSRVFTIMTTNCMAKLPPELFRPGRVDSVIRIERLTLTEAKIFAKKVFLSVIGSVSNMYQDSVILQSIAEKKQLTFSHVEVSELVYTCIKRHKWYKSHEKIS